MSLTLRDEDLVASAVCVLAHKEIGDGWLLWEPETIWRELEVAPGNRSQLMAGRGLLVHGRFFYDGLVFDKTCAAFCDEIIDVDGFDDTCVAHLAWGVDEAQKITDLFHDNWLKFDYEPAGIAAQQLREEGFVLAPEELSFAQDTLDKLWGAPAKELKQRVAAAARSRPNRDMTFEETPDGVQLARLVAVQALLDERRRTRASQLARL